MLAFLLIVGVSYYLVATSLIGLVGDSLFSDRMRQDHAAADQLAAELGPLYAERDMEKAQQLLEAAGGELGGRILLLDQSGKVQLDSYGEIQGARLEYPEVCSILVKGQSVDYGVHELDSGARLDTSRLLFVRRTGAAWVGYCTAGVVSASEIIGVLLLVSPVQEMMQSLYQLQDQMILIFVIIAAMALLCSLVFSRVITNPIAGLMRGIQRMAKGDFSARVRVKGSGEMKQLAQAFNSMSEKLETLDQSRNQFVSNASHELKTPLATMKIMLESLIYQPDMDKELRTEFMNDINSEIDRLSNVVSDLLTLVHIDSHKLRLRREMMVLADTVRETAARLGPLAKKRGQQIVVHIQDECEMFADPGKLAQVCYNIIENAIKYTPDGGTITVSLAKAGRDAVLEIADTGVGIPEADLPHVFDRFYRVDKARSRETGGTGLGLSIVKQIVRLHAGTVTVASEYGKGTTFTVQLPVK